MKKLFLIAISICVVAFSGCSNNSDDNLNKTSPYEGTWALVASGYYEEDCLEYEEIEELMVFNSSVMSIYYIKEQAYKLQNGYLIGCTMSDFECEDTMSYSIQNDQLYLDGDYQGNIKFENGLLILYHNEGNPENDYYNKYQRVNGFK